MGLSLAAAHDIYWAPLKGNPVERESNACSSFIVSFLYEN